MDPVENPWDGIEELGEALGAAGSVQEIGRHVAGFVERYDLFPLTGLYLEEPETSLTRLVWARGLTEDERASAEISHPHRHPGLVMRTGELLHVPDVLADPSARTDSGGTREVEVRSRLYLPIRSLGRVVGTLGVASAEPHAFDQESRRLLRSMVAVIGVAVAQISTASALRRREEMLMAMAAANEVMLANRGLGPTASPLTALAHVAGFERIFLLAAGGPPDDLDCAPPRPCQLTAVYGPLPGDSSDYEALIRAVREDGTAIQVPFSGAGISAPEGGPEKQGSLVLAPASHGDTPRITMVFESRENTRTWRPDELAVFKMAARLHVGSQAHLRAQKLLRQRAEDQRILLDTIDTQVWYLDSVDRYGAVNRAHAEFMGMASAELTGKRLSDFLSPAEVAVCRESNLEVFTSRVPVTTEEWVVDPTGQQRLLSIRKTPRLSADGQVSFVVAAARDITEEHHARQHQRVLLDLLNQLASLSDRGLAFDEILQATMQLDSIDMGGIYLVGDDGLQLAAHVGLEESFLERVVFYPRGSLNEQLVQQGSAVYLSAASLAVRTGQKADSKMPFQSISSNPVLHDGRVVAVLNAGSSTLTDIPRWTRESLEIMAASIGAVLERVRVQEEVRSQQEDLHRFFDSIDDLVVMVGADQRLLLANQAVYRRLGLTPDDVIGADVLSLHPPEVHGHAAEILGAMIRGEKETCPLPLLRSDGSHLHVETKVVQGNWGGQPVLFGISRDISERVEAERALRRAHRDLELRVEERTTELRQLNNTLREENVQRRQVERRLLHERGRLRNLAAELSRVEDRERRRLAAGLHDTVGQVLAACQMDLLQLGRFPLPPEPKALLEKLGAQVLDATRQTRSMTFELSPAVLYELGLPSALRRLGQTFQEQHGVRFSVAVHGLSDEIDDDRRAFLYRVARELMWNAVKHAQAEQVQIELTGDGGGLRVVVRDDGVGFPEPRGHHRLDRGFGLFSIGQRVAAMGGVLTTDNEPGTGARVSLSLP